MWATWEQHCYREHGCSLHDGAPITDHGVYTVYSYDQIIAEYDPVDGTLHLNERQYSNKTSEHQTQASLWTGRNVANRDGTYGVQYEIVWSKL